MNKTPEGPSAFIQGMQASHRQVALTIAGFDPSSGAGVTADLKVFAAHGVYGMAAITALTVQSTQGVRRCESVEVDLLQQTLDCLGEDVSFAGIKIGMLGAAATVEAVAGFLERGGAALPRRGRVVLDPVLRSTSGRALLDASGISVLRQRLLAQVGWITPNREELEALTEIRADTRQAVAAGALHLRAMAMEGGNAELNVVVTGGALARPDDYLLTAAGEEFWLPGEHIATNATHGTGCAFSSALLCGLVAGYPAYDAAANAKAYVATALKAAYPVGHGTGPMHHLHRFDQGMNQGS